MNRILILSQYFFPEVGAPQTRYMELCKRFLNKGYEVNILTAMPNYPKMEIYQGYIGKYYLNENIKGFNVHRSYIFVKKATSLKFRMLNYLSFVMSSLVVGMFKLKSQDIIICESPPLFLGITAIILKKYLRAKLVMNIADLWPEQAEKLGLVTNKYILKFTYWLEKFIYNHSDLISGQTMGIVNNIKNRFPEFNVFWLRNGIDVNNYHDIKENPDIIKPFSKSDFILIYAGIIGYAQGLDTILMCANVLKDQNDIKFLLVGSGPEKNRLMELSKSMKLENLIFIDPVPKSEVPGLVSLSKAGIVPLKKMPFFQGAIPSKIFDVLGSRRPIILGVEGEAFDLFIKRGKCGLFFEPENYIDLSEKIKLLYSDSTLRNELAANGYSFVSEYFNWDSIAEEFLIEISNNLH